METPDEVSTWIVVVVVARRLVPNGRVLERLRLAEPSSDALAVVAAIVLLSNALLLTALVF